MRKIIAFFVCLNMTSITLLCQQADSIGSSINYLQPIPTNKPTVEIGVDMGANYTDMLSVYIWDNKYVTRKQGFLAGMTVQLNAKRALAVQTGTYYVARVYSSEYIVRNYDFISVPLTLKIYFDKKRRFYIAGGTFADFLIAQNVSTFDLSYYYKDFSLSRSTIIGFIGGLGYDVRLSNELKLSIDAKYSSAFTEFIRGEEVEIHSVNACLGFKYQLGSKKQ